MKNLAELKRTLVKGTKVVMTRHDWYPDSHILNVVREVKDVQTNGVSFKNSTGENKTPGWLMFDRGASSFLFNGTNVFSVLLDPSRSSELSPKMTYEVVG